ncbi:hypothetical protein DCC81_11210 [Chitinophaga parva]|uniref:PKD-like family protein n=1 Tax=Chitinophaga parva TaxID=2169414 RepID=A0A2T7BF22_9BACT|nr:PKD-like family lipoprotein [Chitinophaga parva]PUZ24887.1 hypothetical protein DCC81_11210 [Chitinophaga parva]
MRLRFIFLLLPLALLLHACKKDLGNYNYHPPSEPMLDGVDGNIVPATVGDTLIYMPYVFLQGADPAKDLQFDWSILVPEEARAVHYTGYPLKIVYNLKPMLRDAELVITDKRNGIKYFHDFQVQGTTQFSQGATVLSVDNGVTKLSFIRPDSTVMANLYEALHQEDLPANPQQLFAKPAAYQEGSVEDYWVICKDPAKTSVIIDGSTMLRKRYFNEQFFTAPSPLVTEAFDGTSGIPTGIINGKLYLSVTTTAPYAPDFGKFSNMASGVGGDYTLSKFYNRLPSCFFGFDTKSNGFVTFDGQGNYMGNDYMVAADVFDPKALGDGELIYLHAVPGTSYAFFKSTDGNLYEYTFYIDMDNYDQRTIKPVRKRVFKGASLVQADTKWQRSGTDVYYFTSGDKVYRYNPLNEDLRPLKTDFQGKKVTMIKLVNNDNQLRVGVDGSVTKLDVSVGKDGAFISRVDGIPGSPVDIIIKN